MSRRGWSRYTCFNSYRQCPFLNRYCPRELSHWPGTQAERPRGGRRHAPFTQTQSREPRFQYPSVHTYPRPGACPIAPYRGGGGGPNRTPTPPEYRGPAQEAPVNIATANIAAGRNFFSIALLLLNFLEHLGCHYLPRAITLPDFKHILAAEPDCTIVDYLGGGT